jgi:hypothetical protein
MVSSRVGLAVPDRVNVSEVDWRGRTVVEVRSSCTLHTADACHYVRIEAYVLSRTDETPFGSVGALVVPGFGVGFLWWVCAYRLYILLVVLRLSVESLWKWCCERFWGCCFCWCDRRDRLFHRDCDYYSCWALTDVGMQSIDCTGVALDGMAVEIEVDTYLPCG